MFKKVFYLGERYGIITLYIVGGITLLTDCEIAKSVKMLKIKDVAKKVGIAEDELIQYGAYKAKVTSELEKRVSNNRKGKLILVTAVNPTPAGEGKTTTTVGLGQAMWKLGKKSIIALREPSLGPVFGIKGGAAGGGWSQVLPMEDINLHFTGDLHAITTANNLLAALCDNHIQQGNALGIDPKSIEVRRVLDMNDRVLRQIVVGLGGAKNGVTREDGFMISVASEVMAILCLSENLADLKRRFGEILIGYSYEGKPIFAKDINAHGAMAALFKEAALPNLVQTIEGTPCIMHGGPFANIAHGCNSIRATNLALKLSDYAITEAGFGADLGAEKFFDIKCRKAGFAPDCAVLVATVRALKYNGGIPKTELKEENVDALLRGIVNLNAHIENIKKYGVPVVVAINKFDTDTDAELNVIADACRALGAEFAISDVFAKGGDGGVELAKKVIAVADSGKADFKVLYPDDMSLCDKIRTIAREIYGADDVDFIPQAEKKLARFEEMGCRNMPVCIAKTQYSLSDNPALLGRPEGFNITIRDARVSMGAGFVVALSGEIMTMPGLPKRPAAENIDIDDEGNITGLF